MIVPSIDLRGGNAVQLVGGRALAIDAGDPFPIAERFGRAGEIAVVDLDAALGTGDNRSIVRNLVRRVPCRVGGGIRTVEDALAWLDLGAASVVIGTRAEPEFLERLPKARVVAAVDAVGDDVVVEGWRTRTGRSVADTIRELAPYVGGFLLTFVDREGRLEGSDLARAKELVDLAGDARVTIAGGIVEPDEIAALDRMGADAQVGMALYSGRLGLAEAFAAPLVSDRPDGLWPTVVCDRSGVALGLAWSDIESLRTVFETGRGAYRSRRRGSWIKGASSGNVQRVVRVDADCDRDALRVTVDQSGPGFCHRDSRSCFASEDRGLGALERRVRGAIAAGPAASYSSRLAGDPDTLSGKLMEEAAELASAVTRDEVVHEAADVAYFATVALARAGLDWADVEAELDRRALRVRRRPPSEPKLADEVIP